MDYVMVLEYVDKDWVIQLSNSEDYDNIYLAALFVKDKGKGIGTDLMNKILDYCDENNYKLYLHPFPLEYTKDKLIAVYYGNSFDLSKITKSANFTIFAKSIDFTPFEKFCKKTTRFKQSVLDI